MPYWWILLCNFSPTYLSLCQEGMGKGVLWVEYVVHVPTQIIADWMES